MTSDVVTRIREDLTKSGMHSELLVRKAFRDAGWNESGPCAYFDRDEEKSRETDLCATNVLNLQSDGVTCIHSEHSAVVEVKKSEKPWVIFKRNLRDRPVGCAWNNLIAKTHMPCEPRKLVASLGEHSLITECQWEGAGIHEAFKPPDNSSRWYSAFVSTVKAAYEMRRELPSSDAQSRNLKARPAEFFFFQPLVVLDGLLFSAELNENGEIEVNEIDAAPFRFAYRSEAYRGESFRVDLVTLRGLPEHIERMTKRQRSIVDGIAHESDLVLT